jgi:hypothetical protein
MTNQGGAPIRVLDDKEKTRLESVRERAAQTWAQIQRKAPGDPLGALAWEAGVMGPTPPDPSRMLDLMERARHEGFAWREISDALGEGDSPEAGRRVRDRYKSWSEA